MERYYLEVASNTGRTTLPALGQVLCKILRLLSLRDRGATPKGFSPRPTGADGLRTTDSRSCYYQTLVAHAYKASFCALCRLAIACTSKELRDFVYAHQEILFPNLAVIACIDTEHAPRPPKQLDVPPSPTTSLALIDDDLIHHDAFLSLGSADPTHRFGSPSSAFSFPDHEHEAEEEEALTSFNDMLHWASKRKKLRRLRVAVSTTPARPDIISSASATLSRSLRCLPSLISLDIRFETVTDAPWVPVYAQSGDPKLCPRVATHRVRDLILALNPSSLRQLCLRGTDVCLPQETSRLTALTALRAISEDVSGRHGGVVVQGLRCLPASLRRLSLLGLSPSENHVPPAVGALSGLQSLTLDWACGEACVGQGAPRGGAPCVDLSLFEEITGTRDERRREKMGESDWDVRGRLGLETLGSASHWSDNLTHLCLNYFRAKTLPRRLPKGLKSLELQNNLEFGSTGGAAMWHSRRASVASDVEAYHQSFSAVSRSTNLTRLCLNNSLGGWGLPGAVCALTSLKSLGAVAGSPFADWEGMQRSVGKHLGELTGLTSLDIEIYDAATNGMELAAALPHLQRLRLAKADTAEAYVVSGARQSLLQGLIRLLPSLPSLKECQTEGMLLPATSACGMWARLLGPGTSPAQRCEAERAVAALRQRKVLLGRWYVTMSLKSKEGNYGDVPWDEVDATEVEALYY